MLQDFDSRQLDELRSVLLGRNKAEKRGYDRKRRYCWKRTGRRMSHFFLKMFIPSKACWEGCSENTLKYYQTTIERLLSGQASKWIKD